MSDACHSQKRSEASAAKPHDADLQTYIKGFSSESKINKRISMLCLQKVLLIAGA